LIDRDYARPLTLASLAAAVRKDRAYVAKMFRRHTGHTVHGYLTSVRVQRAGELIRQGHKIEAVMLLVGYRSKKNFYRQFRAQTGLTPGSYRAVAPKDPNAKSVRPVRPALGETPTTFPANGAGANRSRCSS
jgi:YesN/AraC family two-component response regulator